MEPAINRLPNRRNKDPPRAQDEAIKKQDARNFLVMMLKFLTAKSEVKDLYLQFGEALASFIKHVDLGTSVVTHSLFIHKLNRAKWYRIEEDMRIVAKLTK